MRLFVVAALSLTLVSCAPRGPARPADRYQLLPASETSVEPVDGMLKANFIGIRSGEACLIELPNDTTMLVDTGASGVGLELATILKNMGVTKIDHFVITKIGDGYHNMNLISIINTVEVGRFYMAPRGRTLTFNAGVSGTLEILEQRGVPVIEAGSGVAIFEYKNLRASFLGPKDQEREYSAVFGLTYGEHTFFFADDGDSKAEKEIVERDGTPDVTVLSVGNTREFPGGPEKCAALIEKCYPEIAVIYGEVAMDQVKKLEIEMVKPNDMSLTAPPVRQQIVWVVSTDGEEITSEKRYVELE